MEIGVDLLGNYVLLLVVKAELLLPFKVHDIDDLVVLQLLNDIPEMHVLSDKCNESLAL